MSTNTSLAGIAGLEGRVALVTGGTGAIGSAVCRFLADDGLKIAVVDLDQSKCDEFAASLPTESIGIAIDVSDPDAVTKGCEEIASRLGTVDVLVNVAGILSNNKLMKTTPSECTCT